MSDGGARLPVPKPRHLSSPRQTTHESGVLLREALGEQLRPRVEGGRSRAGARRPHSPHSTQPAPRRCTARADPPSPPLEEHVAPPCFVTSLHPRQHRVVRAPAPPMHALLARSGAHTTPTLPPPSCAGQRHGTGVKWTDTPLHLRPVHRPGRLQRHHHRGRRRPPPPASLARRLHQEAPA